MPRTLWRLMVVGAAVAAATAVALVVQEEDPTAPTCGRPTYEAGDSIELGSLYGLTGLPAEVKVGEVEYMVEDPKDVHAFDERITVWEMEYLSRGTRRRQFIGVPEETSRSGGLIVGLHGSNSEGDGARDLIEPPSLPDYQARWPLYVSAETGLPFVAPDSPRFGEYEYEVERASEPLIDDATGIVAAVQFLHGQNMSVRRCLFVGGISRGGIRANYLGAALDDVTFTYSAGSILSKEVDSTTPERSPDAWADSDIDFVDIIAASRGTWRMVWGHGDYVWKAHAEPDALIAELSQRMGKRLSFGRVGDGHVIIPADVLGFARRYVDSLRSAAR